MNHKSTSIGIFLGISWLYACIHLDRQILGILVESVKTDLQLSDRQLGSLTGTAFSIVYALLGLFFGSLADRVDRLSLVKKGAWIWSVASMGAACASSYAALVVARAGVAVGEAVATAAAVSLMSELAGERFRARATSAFLISAFVGAGAAAILGGAIVGLVPRTSGIAGWRVALLAAGLPGIAGAMYLSIFHRRASGERPHQPGSRRGELWVLAIAAFGAILLQVRAPPTLSVPLCVSSALLVATWWAWRLRRFDPAAYTATVGQKAFRYLVLAFSAVLFVDYAAAFWLIPFAQRRFGISAAMAGSQMGGVMILGGIAGCLLGGWSADRWRSFRASGRVWTALIAVLMESAAILIALAQSDVHAFMLAFSVFCVASGGWTGVAAAIAFDIVPREHRGTGTAVYFLLTTILGPGLGPFVVGWGSDRWGSVSTPLAVSCTILVIAVAALTRLGLSFENSEARRIDRTDAVV